MKRQFFTLIGIAGLTVFATGCEEEETVTLAGQVDYAAYTDGVILIKACESESSEHSGIGSVSVQTPGNCVAETVVDGPGAFSLKAVITWASSEPHIELLAYLVAERASPVYNCIAGAVEVLPVGNHRDLTLSLETQHCPMRE